MGAESITDAYRQAHAYYNAGNYSRCREVALEALNTSAEDVRLLQLAGRASLELGRDDATVYLQKVVNLQPDDVEAWQDLGDALIDEGRLPEAVDVLRESVRLRPTSSAALVDLGHTLHALGHTDEAIVYLQRAAEAEPGNLSTLRSLVDMYRRLGRLDEALEVARQIVDLRPEDVLATMDVADLSRDLGHFDAAMRAYHRLREIDTDQTPIDHEVYAYHSMIQTEMQRERWRRVLDLAIDATRVDRYGLTTDVLSFAVAQVFGASDRPAPARAEIDAALALEQAEHRHLHTEALSL